LVKSGPIGGGDERKPRELWRIVIWEKDACLFSWQFGHCQKWRANQVLQPFLDVFRLDWGHSFHSSFFPLLFSHSFSPQLKIQWGQIAFLGLFLCRILWDENVGERKEGCFFQLEFCLGKEMKQMCGGVGRMKGRKVPILLLLPPPLNSVADWPRLR
jgi:hypothetical protein